LPYTTKFSSEWKEPLGPKNIKGASFSAASVLNRTVLGSFADIGKLKSTNAHIHVYRLQKLHVYIRMCVQVTIVFVVWKKFFFAIIYIKSFKFVYWAEQALCAD